jgi:hypothetical protein
LKLLFNFEYSGEGGQFYEQTPDGHMRKVAPNIQRLIQQEIQQALQLGERRTTEPQDLVKGIVFFNLSILTRFILGPDGSTYERGPLGQFYGKYLQSF